MIIKGKKDFIDEITKFGIKTEYAVVKPNWVSNREGEFTEPEILSWLFEALPNQKKIVVESYTPWRGLKFIESDSHKGKGVTLDGGRVHWDFYKRQDQHFLDTTGIGNVLEKHKVDYINITNEVWSGKCIDPGIIKKEITRKNARIAWEDLYSYIPQKLYEIRKSSTLISLSKIKFEEGIPAIYISMSIKNLFGLIPHPSRWIPFHGENHESVPEVTHDIYTLYTCLFDKTLWIAEGINTLVRNYCEPDQKVVKKQNLLFIGRSGKQVDTEACKILGIDPAKVPHLQLITT